MKLDTPNLQTRVNDQVKSDAETSMNEEEARRREMTQMMVWIGW
jgi:hypothetical protein